MGRGAWWGTFHGVAELDTAEGLTHTHTHTRSMQGLNGIPIMPALHTQGTSPPAEFSCWIFNEASLALALYIFSLFWVVQAVTEHLD